MYRLSATLEPPHQNDVKAVAVLNEKGIVSASRDGTVRLWSLDPAQGAAWTIAATFEGHQGFVNSVTCLAPSTEHPEGLVVSGGQDKTIQVWDPRQPAEPVYILLGHDGNVCFLTTSAAGHIISTSWDNTAIVWHDFKQRYHLKGHEAAVWSATALDDDRYATASADKSIKLWQGGTLLRTLQNAHGDVVRSLAPLPAIGFLSAANDAVIKVWSSEGEIIQELHGHTSFIYAVKAMAADRYISSGEDRSIRYWKDGGCVQVLQYPAISVWTIAHFANGDIVAGGSDGMVRCFTMDAGRTANADALQAYENQIAQQALPTNQVGDVQKDKLPSLDALSQPGKKEGEVKMVRVGQAVEAHQWSNSDGQWHKIGEVVDAIGSDRKQLYKGKEWDHVFDVALEDNAPALKLPYNATENPYEAAQRFLHENEIGQHHLEQVAQFIIQNAKTTTLGAPAVSSGDPFTGANRYVPPSASSSSTSTFKKSDTAATATANAAASAPSASAAETLPVKRGAYSFFRTISADPLKQKIAATNATMDSDKQLSDAHSKTLDTITRDLLASKTLNSEQTDLITTLLFWPANARLPGLDLLRTALLYNPMGDFGLDLIGLIRLYGLDVPAKAEDAVVMLGLRALSNLFAKDAIPLGIDDAIHLLLQTVSACLKVKVTQKQIRIAGMTVYLNLTLLLLYERSAAATERDAVLRALLQVLIPALIAEKQTDAYLRGLAALGSILLKTSGAIHEEAAAGYQRVRDAKKGSEHETHAQVKTMYKQIPL